ncbi:MAG: LPS export ABC transporter periplasmic protein LptC [Leptonema sp. (in: bacteria)]
MQSYPTLKEEEKEPFANLRISKFHRIHYKGLGIKKWELNSEEAYIYNEQKTNEVYKIIVYEFSFEQFLPSKAYLQSKKAVLDYKNNQLYLIGDSEYKDTELMVSGNELYYNLENEVLFTDSEVEIKKDKNKIQCLKGIYYSKKEGIQKCKKPKGQLLQNRDKKDTNNNFFF